MLFRSGENLESGAIDFIKSNEHITLFSAYLKLKQLEKINASKRIKEIVVRWEFHDLCQGASDLEVYEYCKKNNITLYRNPRIHLKAIWNNYNNIFYGSANITKRGLGENGVFNYELNGISRVLSLKDKLYLKKIISKSELIDESSYLKFKAFVENNSYKQPKLPEITLTSPNEDKFLLSQLPMSINPQFLLDSFFEENKLIEFEEKCLLHDLSTYNIDTSLDRVDMENQLKVNFNNHPFVLALKDHIKKQKRQSLNYGGVVRWIQNNTTTVPTPRSWEMKKKKIVNILYEWICYFDNNFFWNRPSYTEVIYYNLKLKLNDKYR